MTRSVDVVVIGGGPGGYVAAIRAAQLGLETVIVEKDPELGGTCLHRGCIPTKAWLHTAEVLDGARHASDFGVMIEGSPSVDLERAASYRGKVVSKNARGVAHLIKKNGVERVHGWGSLDGANRVRVRAEDAEQAFRARNVVIATGSVPRPFPLAPTDGRHIVDSDQLLEMDRVPESLLVLGGGAVGCEFASVFASLGSDVTLVELLPHLVPQEDDDVSAELEKSFRRRGIEVLTNSRLVSATPGAAGASVKLSTPDGELDRSFDVVLVAIGRQAVLEGVGLEEAGVSVENGFVTVNEWMQTSQPSVYAIGDVVATPWLAHVASAEGMLAAEHMAGEDCSPINYDLVPSCTYCSPEVASVGLTEREARARGYDVETGRFPFAASGKAAILGRGDGFVKLIRERRYDELLGAHIIGPHATDLVAEACVALRLESTTEELFRAMHAHPTLSEVIPEAAMVALGRGVHV